MASNNNADDLQMNDLEELGNEAAAPSKPKVKFVGPVKPSELKEQKSMAQTKKERWQLIFKYSKIAFLVAIWLIFSVCLFMTPEKMIYPTFLIVPADATKEYAIRSKDVESRLGVNLKGAFSFDDELKNVASRDTSTPTWLTAWLICAYYDANDVLISKERVSDDQKIKMVPEENINSSPSFWVHEIYNLYKQTPPDGTHKKVYILAIDTDATRDVPLKVYFDYHPIDTRLGIIYGGLVLLFLYVFIIWEVINRTFASIIAATLALGILAAFKSRPTMQMIMSWVDVETLLLLFGMMILVAILSDSGIFDYLAVFAYQITKGDVWPLINCLCAFVGVLSAFLDNVTMMLLVTPVTIRLAEVTDVNPVPILMCMVIFSNIGAALTPVGDPPNVIITSNPIVHSQNVNFGTFFLHMAPGVVFAAIISYFYLRFHYRKFGKTERKESKEIEELRREIHVWQRAAESITIYSKDEEMVRETLLNKVQSLKDRLEELEENQQKIEPKKQFEQTLTKLKADYPIRNKVLLIKASVVFLFVVVLFVLHSVPHLHNLSLGWAALLGALLLLVLAEVEDVESILVRIEWSTLLFFAALFILMEALSSLGVIDLIGGLVVRLVLSVGARYRLMVAILIVLWISAVASSFLANIPVTTMMLKIIISLSQNKELNLPLHPLVWALASGACFGGNGTLIGASANVVCAGVIEQHGYKFTFVDFFLVGFPVMILTIITTTGYLLLAHCALQWH